MPKEKALTYEIKIPDHVLTRVVDGELIILDLNRGVYCGLDEIGALFWTELSKGKNMDDAIDRLLETYDVSRATLKADLQSLLEDLTSKNLVEIL